MPTSFDALVPHSKFKKKLLVNPYATLENEECCYWAEIGLMYVAIHKHKVGILQQRVIGTQQESDIFLSYCEPITASLKRPSLMYTGWLWFATPSFGSNNPLLGSMVRRGDMELAEFVAGTVENWAREYRRSGRC